MSDEYRWPEATTAVLRNGLTAKDVIEALYAPTSLRLDNRTPSDAPTFMAVCAPTEALHLIVVVCTRTDATGPWTIVGARDAGSNETQIWRKRTS